MDFPFALAARARVRTLMAMNAYLNGQALGHVNGFKITYKTPIQQADLSFLTPTSSSGTVQAHLTGAGKKFFEQLRAEMTPEYPCELTVGDQRFPAELDLEKGQLIVWPPKEYVEKLMPGFVDGKTVEVSLVDPSPSVRWNEPIRERNGAEVRIGMRDDKKAAIEILSPGGVA